jgi:hypothetical protein
MVGGISRPGVAESHRGVRSRRFLHEQKRHRLSHGVGSPENDDVAMIDLDSIREQKHLNTKRRARDKTRAADREPPHILGVKPINVLQRIDCVDDFLCIYGFRQRELNQNAVNRWIGVEVLEDLEKFPFRARIGRLVQPARHTRGLTGPSLVADVNLARRMPSDKDDGEAGANSGVRKKLSHLMAQFELDRLRECLAVQNLSVQSHGSACELRVQKASCEPQWL